MKWIFEVSRFIGKMSPKETMEKKGEKGKLVSSSLRFPCIHDILV